MAASSSSTPANDHISEVSSWIHDEGRCVTTQSVAWTFGLSRIQASEILTKCVVGDEKAYQVTTIMQPKQTENDGLTQTVFGLTKSAVSSPNDIAALEGAVYAISLESTSEKLPTAHQKDLQLLRDQLSNFQHAVVFDHAATDIEATVDMERQDAQASQQARWNQMGQVATDRRGVTAAVTISKVRTTTTATTFFEDKAKAAASAASTKTETTKPSSSSSTKESAAPPSKKKSFFGKSSTSKFSSTSTKPTSTKPTPTTASPPVPTPEEKENTPNVGTADDFIGDEDEDDDFEEQETERQKRNAAAMKEQEDREKARVAREKKQADVVEEEEAPTVSIGKKRRKKLVEKTSMDEHGYMHTEMQVVWEEVEDIVPVKPKTKAVKSTKNMKQGNLMGFFSKKK